MASNPRQITSADLFFQNGNKDDVYVGIISIHNVLLQEKYYLIHMLMEYLKLQLIQNFAARI